MNNLDDLNVGVYHLRRLYSPRVCSYSATPSPVSRPPPFASHPAMSSVVSHFFVPPTATDTVFSIFSIAILYLSISLDYRQKSSHSSSGTVQPFFYITYPSRKPIHQRVSPLYHYCARFSSNSTSRQTSVASILHHHLPSTPSLLSSPSPSPSPTPSPLRPRLCTPRLFRCFDAPAIVVRPPRSTAVDVRDRALALILTPSR